MPTKTTVDATDTADGTIIGKDNSNDGTRTVKISLFPDEDVIVVSSKEKQAKNGDNTSFAWALVKIAGGYFGAIAVGTLAIGGAMAASDKLFGTDMTGRKTRDLQKQGNDIWNRQVGNINEQAAKHQTLA